MSSAELIEFFALFQITGNTDYVIIPFPNQNGATLMTGSDRFCGLGLNPTTSKRKREFSQLIWECQWSSSFSSKYWIWMFCCRQCVTVCCICDHWRQRAIGYWKSRLCIIVFTKWMSSDIEGLSSVGVDPKSFYPVTTRKR